MQEAIKKKESDIEEIKRINEQLTNKNTELEQEVKHFKDKTTLVSEIEDLKKAKQKMLDDVFTVKKEVATQKDQQHIQLQEQTTQSKLQPKSQPKPQPKSQPKPQLKPQSKPQPNPQPVTAVYTYQPIF